VAEERKAARLHPLVITAIFVVVFLEIHPFQDGNGRLSRVLTTLLLLQAGYSYVPYSSLETVVEQSKEAYYLALRQTQETIRTEAPNWQPWVGYFLRSLAEQVRRLETKIDSYWLRCPSSRCRSSSSRASTVGSRWPMRSA
jgi:Fic family protein